MNHQPQIQANIDALRERIPKTQELYREVCALLFFHYGITPTANMLYRYVRKGSMSAPAEALAKFWEELRERNRPRIEHAALPDELKAEAGEMIAALWSKAQAAAQEGLRTLRVEAHAAVVEAQSAVAAAEDQARRLEQIRLSFRTAVQRIRSLEQELATERAVRTALAMQLDAALQPSATPEAPLPGDAATERPIMAKRDRSPTPCRQPGEIAYAALPASSGCSGAAS